MRRQVHVITPGDHFSPRTGSAVPTVVDGLCRFAPSDSGRASVAVARGTYEDRYDSADVIEYQPASPLPGRLDDVGRYLDVASARFGLPRWFSRRPLAASLAGQSSWEPSFVFGHNAPQLIPLVDAGRHRPILYAHNLLLRSYSLAEASRVLDRVAAIICVSASLADATASHLPAPLRDRIRVVRNGVDLAAFQRESPLSRSGPLKVTFVGRMIPDKGADILIDAIGLLDRDDVSLTVVGSSGFSAADALTDYEKQIRASAATLRRPARIVPFVPRRDVPELLRQADVVVVPSRWPDPCPLTTLEGMAAGAAVIGAEIGGIPESIRGAGILFEPNNVRELAGVIEALADDDALLNTTAQACSAYARDHDWAWSSAILQRELRALDV